MTVILGFAGSTLGFPRGALLRPSGPQCGRSHRAAGGVFALESNLIVCARDRWGTLRCEDDAVDASTRKWRSIAPLPIMPKPAAKVPQPIATLPLQLG